MARPTGWDILGMDEDPTPGVVETVQALAKLFGDFAHDVESAYNSLNSFGRDTTALDWVGQTAEAFKGQFGPLPGRLQKLYISYSEASDALSAYAPKLQAAQSKADSALRQAQDAEVDLQRATTTANNAASDLKTAQQNHAANPNPKAVSDAQTAHDTAQAGLKNAQDRMDALKAQAHQAHDDLDTAAKDCAKALHHAQHDGIHNKHWWQHVGEFLSEWGGKIGEIAGEIAPVLDILAIATAWIPGVDVVTAGLAEADNMVALVTTGLQVAGDTMQGHYGDALMGAGMLGVTVVGGRALGSVGGKVLGKLGREAEGEAEHTAGSAARSVEHDGGDVEPGSTHSGADGEPEAAPNSGENAVGEDARTSEGNQDANTHTDPVDVVSGWMLTDATDVELPGVLPLLLRRAYASGYAAGRLFGPGWSSTLDQRLSINESGIHVVGDDAQRLDYPAPVSDEQVMPTRGSRWPLVWDRGADEIRVTDPWSGQTRHFAVVHFENESGQIRDLTALSDRNGNRITIVRDEQGTPILVEHPGYHIAVDTVATSAGLRISGLRLLVGDDGAETVLKQFRYDDRGRLVHVVNSSGIPFTYEWGQDDRISAWQDHSGYRYDYFYDHLGRVTRGEGAFLSGTFEYDPANRTTVVTNSLGHATTIVYDRCGHTASETDCLGNITITQTDEYGRVLSRIDALGNTTTFEQDATGDVVRTVAADGAVSMFTYNELHQVIEAVDPDGTSWRREYDACGNVIAVTDPSGAVTEFRYAPNGALTSVVDPLGAITQITCDLAGLPVAVRDAVGGETQMVRDEAGRVIRSTDALGAVTTFEWTVEGHPISRTTPDGAVTRWRHDAGGRLLEVVDPIGATTVFEPGPMGTLNGRTGPDGVRHSFRYDSEMNLLQVANPAGALWQYVYDPAGNLVAESDFRGRNLTYEYDAAGRISAWTTPYGQRLTLERDASGRVTRRSTPEGDYEYRYDAGGRLVEATGPQTVLTLDRDRSGRIVGETVDGRTTRFDYDLAGRRTGRVTSSGMASMWTLDSAGRPVALQAGTGRIELVRDVSGQEIERLLGAHARLTRQYDAVGRPVTERMVTDGPGVGSVVATVGVEAEQTGTGAGGSALSRSWVWRADGVPEEIRDSLRGTRRYTTDNSGRVTAVSAHAWNENYAYDEFGNLAVGAGGPEELFGRVAASTSATGAQAQPADRTHHDYDDAGRLVRTVRRTLDGRRKVWAYTWDSQDRLVKVDTPDRGTWCYSYDPVGRRTSKYQIGDAGQVEEKVLFTWDGARLAEELTSGPDGSIVALTWDYEPGSFRAAAQRLRRRSTGTATDADVDSNTSDSDQERFDEAFHAIITDLVGAPTELIDANGRIVWHTTASLWGRTISSSSDSSADCPLRFPGQYHDRETGLHYNLHRYYNPDTAAYLTPDPLGLAPSPNDHAYVPNPLTLFDPLGLAYEGADKGSQWFPDENYTPDEVNKRSADWREVFDDRNARAAQKEIAKGRGPREIGRIDEPEESVKGSKWHAQGPGKGSPGINMDGTFHDGEPNWSSKTLDWLRQYGWNV